MYARCTFTYTKRRGVVEGRIARPIEAVMIVEMDKSKGVFGGPSGPSREGPGVGHKIVSDTKQMTKERKKKKKNEWEKGKMCKEKKWKKEREKNGQK